MAHKKKDDLTRAAAKENRFSTTDTDQDIQSNVLRNGSEKEKKQMPVVRIRMKPDDIEILQHYAEQEGLSLSAVVRQAVSRFMRRQGLK